MQMENKKTFFSGLAVGVVLVVVINVVFSTATATYYKATGKKLPPEKKLSQILTILEQYYVDDFDKEELVENMYAGFVYGIGDPYTAYMDEERLSAFKEEIEGTFTGVGLNVAPDLKSNRIAVIAPFEGSPADKAGIKPKDLIMKVNGFDVFADTLSEAVAMMKGVPNTSVNVTIYRESENKTFNVDIMREEINVPTVFHKLLEDDIGYIRLSGFESVTYDQFMIAYNELNAAKMKGLVIDLRNNPGGLLDIVTQIADVLVPEGYIVYTEDRQGNTRYINSDKERINIPLAILVNENSASASEVLAGAVKDLGVGELVGTQTFGKGLVQTIFDLPDGSGVKVTIAKYYTPSGVCINKIGLAPDHLVQMDEELTLNIPNLEFDEDLQLQKAVSVVLNKANSSSAKK